MSHDVLTEEEYQIIYDYLKSLAEKRGIFVFDEKGLPRQDLNQKVSGVYYNNGESIVIFINPEFLFRDTRHKVSTLAHELGHHSLHAGKFSAQFYWTNKDFGKAMEAQADRFADKLMAIQQRKQLQRNCLTA